MKILAIDSSGLVASVAILEDDSLVAEYTVNYKKTHSQTLLPMLDEIKKMTELDLGTIDAIAVAEGPGSFTGLRIGAATAKGLGLALDKPLVGVPTVDALAYNLYETKGIICPMMDARRSQVYTGIYHFEQGKMITDLQQQPLALEEIAEKLNQADAAGNDLNHADADMDDTSSNQVESGSVDLSRKSSGINGPVLLLGDGIPVYMERLKALLHVEYRIVPPHLSRQRAGAVGALGMQYLREGKTIDADAFRPVYLRLSQAERERKERLAAQK